MPGRVREWPAWPEFGNVSDTSDDPDCRSAKQAIIDEYGAENLKQSWIAVCDRLKEVTDDIACRGNEIIPTISAEHVIQNGFTAEEVATIKQTGCLVIRGVIPQTETNELYRDLTQYIADNRPQVKGWPKETPSIMMLYNTPTQNALRTHPNQLAVQRRLNELWHDAAGKTSQDPLIYLDALRDRPPQQPFLGLGPHIDAGSLCRWADPQYRKVYEKVFSGQPEAHDGWDLGARMDANQDLFPGSAHSTVLRTFQGWTALTRTAPNEGTLLLVPNLPATLAYMLLRPFFKPPEDPSRVMDAAEWTLDTGAVFPGTMKPQSQRLSRSSHPHLRLEETLVHIPEMMPGDTVWWHTDVCHAVDPIHEGKGHAAVAYIAACPTTPNNKKYVKEQLESIIAGRVPPDFFPGPETNETTFHGYKGHSGISADARKAFGYDL
ncbi:hypothetical protein F5Y15DRAFT_229161 [Xylariaceae sp. FL0016]|nr:hypothetical protein F5Y15DRAFT_229161 [Xylariaceae sp. FL0016]